MVERTAWSRELHGMKNRIIKRPHPIGNFMWWWIFKIKTMFSEEWWREQWSAGTPKSWGCFHCPLWRHDNVLHHCSSRVHVERQKNHQWSRGRFEKIEMHVKDANYDVFLPCITGVCNTSVLEGVQICNRFSSGRYKAHQFIRWRKYCFVEVIVFFPWLIP